MCWSVSAEDRNTNIVTDIYSRLGCKCSEHLQGIGNRKSRKKYLQPFYFLTGNFLKVCIGYHLKAKQSAIAAGKINNVYIQSAQLVLLSVLSIKS